MTQQQFSDLSFTALHLPESVARGIADAGFEQCTPIQAAALPQGACRARCGRARHRPARARRPHSWSPSSPICCATPPSAEKPSTSPRALILAPTRELAIQIHRDAEILVQYTGLTLGLAFGGVDYDKQRRTLEAGVDVLIGTPGRIIDFFRQHVFDLRHVQVLVLDEADRMFDLGFIKDIRFLLRRLPDPEFRLNMLFSATLSHRVLELAYEHMNDPELIRIEPERITAELVRQVIYYPAMEEKASLLVHLMRKDATRRARWSSSTPSASPNASSACCARTASRPRPCPATCRSESACGCCASSTTASSPCWSRPMSPRAACTSRTSATCSITTCPRIPRITCIASAARHAPGAAGDAVSFGCEQYVESLPEIEAFIGQRIPVGSFDPADLPYLKSAHHAPRSYGDEEDDGPPPNQIHRPPARQGQPGPRRGRQR